MSHIENLRALFNDKANPPALTAVAACLADYCEAREQSGPDREQDAEVYEILLKEKFTPVSEYALGSVLYPEHDFDHVPHLSAIGQVMDALNLNLPVKSDIIANLRKPLPQ